MQLPDTQEEIEDFFLQATLRNAREKNLELYNLAGEPKRNQQDDFDYTLPTSHGMQSLDLMEVAPLKRFHNSYRNVPPSYRIGEFADIIWEQVKERKIKKYGPLPKEVIHLFLYSTDWKLRLNEEILTLMAYWFTTREHYFKTVVYYVPDNQAQGEVRVIHPHPRAAEEFTNFNEAYYRQKSVARADPTTFPRGGGAPKGSSVWVSSVEFIVPLPDERSSSKCI